MLTSSSIRPLRCLLPATGVQVLVTDILVLRNVCSFDYGVTLDLPSEIGGYLLTLMPVSKSHNTIG